MKHVFFEKLEMHNRFCINYKVEELGGLLRRHALALGFCYLQRQRLKFMIIIHQNIRKISSIYYAKCSIKGKLSLMHALFNLLREGKRYSHSQIFCYTEKKAIKTIFFLLLIYKSKQTSFVEYKNFGYTIRRCKCTYFFCRVQ